MRFSTTRTVSRSPFTCRKLYNATVMPRNICYVLSQNDCINHFQLLSSTLRYTILKDCIPYKNVNSFYICTQLYTALKYFLTQTFNVNINYIWKSVIVSSAANISRRYGGHRVVMTAETLNKQNPRRRVICISLIAQDCNTWVWSKEQARDGAGYPEDLYRRTVFHRPPATIRTHIHNQLVHRPSTPSTMPSNRDPRGCLLDLTPVKIPS